MNKVSSILGGIVVIAIAVVFIVQFQPATGAPKSDGPTCAAEIRGDCIPSTHYWAAFRLLAPRGADPAQLRAMGLKRHVLDGLIERQLLVEDAERLGITVDDAEVTRALAGGRLQLSLPASSAEQVGYALGLAPGNVRMVDMTDPATGKFDAKRYEKEIRQWTKMSPTDFREFQKLEMIAARMRDVLASRIRVSEAAARAQFAREKSTATADYVRFDSGFYADRALDTSAEAVDAWAATNQAEIDKVWETRKPQFAGECRVGNHLLVRIDPTSVEALDPDKQKAAAQEVIDKAKKRIESGEPFADVARELSDAPTQESGGEVSCATIGQLPKPVEEAWNKLDAGAMSDPVETAEGLHLVRVDKVLEGEKAEGFGLRQTKQELYRQFEADRLAAEAAKGVLSAVRGGKTLEQALEAHLASVLPEQQPDGESVPLAPIVETTLPFNQSGDPIPGVKPGQSVAKLIFDLEKPGAVPPDVIPLESGYAVVALKDKTTATDEVWEADGEFYWMSMRATKQRDALDKYVKKLREGLSGEVKVNQAIVGDGDATEGDGEPAP